MTVAVEKIVDEVKSLPKAQQEELLAWLAEYELQQRTNGTQRSNATPSRWSFAGND